MALSSRIVKLSSIVGATAVIFLLDWIYLTYVASHGFEVRTQTFALGSSGVSVPLQWLPVVGVVIVALVAWVEVSSRMFPRRGAIEVEALARLRLLRAITFSTAMFVCVLYVPYLIGSNWFWAGLSEISKNVSQVRAFGISLLNANEPLMGVKPLWQYSLSQILAAAVMALTAWRFGRLARRTRKQR